MGLGPSVYSGKLDRIGSLAGDHPGDKSMYFELYQDAAKEWRWRLRAANHRIIADSGEGYQNRADCLHAIDLIKNGAAEAKVWDLAHDPADLVSA
jgi:uncharacterized protein